MSVDCCRAQVVRREKSFDGRSQLIARHDGQQRCGALDELRVGDVVSLTSGSSEVW